MVISLVGDRGVLYWFIPEVNMDRRVKVKSFSCGTIDTYMVNGYILHQSNRALPSYVDMFQVLGVPQS